MSGEIKFVLIVLVMIAVALYIIFLSWIGSEISESRGYGPTLGSVVGALLGPLGLFLMYVLPRREEPPDHGF